MNRTAGVLVVALLAVAIFVLFGPQPTALVDTGEYDCTTVTVEDAAGTELATVDAQIADTPEKRQVGLSRTDSLASGEGMLFVHPDEGTHTYHMRNMSFDLDIVFVAANGTVTTVHHASAGGRLWSDRYTGHGLYVLEAERGWANATGVEPGDVVRVPENVSASS